MKIERGLALVDILRDVHTFIHRWVELIKTAAIFWFTYFKVIFSCLHLTLIYMTASSNNKSLNLEIFTTYFFNVWFDRLDIPVEPRLLVLDRLAEIELVI